MKKRLLAGLLALAMLFTMLPVGAFAAGKTITIRYLEAIDDKPGFFESAGTEQIPVEEEATTVSFDDLTVPEGYEIDSVLTDLTKELKIDRYGRATVYVKKVAPAPVEPVKPAETDSCISALVGMGVVLAGGAAALTYYYREALPIWKCVGIVKLADDTPVKNATVALIRDGETVKTVKTDDNGYFAARVAKDDYEVVVTWTQDGAERTERTKATVDRVAGDIRPQEIILALE